MCFIKHLPRAATYVIKYVAVTNHYDAKDRDENMALQQLMSFLQGLENNGLNLPTSQSQIFLHLT